MERESQVREPEIHEPVATSHALVPARPPRLGRVASWLQRVTGLGAHRAPELPPGLTQRIDALESRLAAHAEETAKRLEESEGRVLNHVQRRFETLEVELEGKLRRHVERELEEQMGSLRRWLVAALLLAIAAAGVAALALLQGFSGASA